MLFEQLEINDTLFTVLFHQGGDLADELVFALVEVQADQEALACFQTRLPIDFRNNVVWVFEIAADGVAACDGDPRQMLIQCQ